MAAHMANREAHVAVGIAAAIFTEILVSKGSPNVGARLFGAILGGYIGARAPDIIDPPSNGPNHRGIGHGVVPVSVAFAAASNDFAHARRWLETRAAGSPPLEQFLFASAVGIMGGFAVSYASHLALDAVTPRGLPVIA